MNQVWTVAVPVTTPIARISAISNAVTYSFAGVLRGAARFPANSSTATGFFTAILHGMPEQWSFNYEVAFAGLTDGLARSQIHLGDRGSTGAIVHELSNTTTLVAAGAKSGTITGAWHSSEIPTLAAAADVFNCFLAGSYYFSVHSAGVFLQLGEICGQIETDSTNQPTTVLGLVTSGALSVAAQRENCKHASKRLAEAYYI